MGFTLGYSEKLSKTFTAKQENLNTFKGKMVYIPEGEFTMGHNNIPTGRGPFGQSLSAPEIQVKLDAFEMGATEVTNSQYVAYLNAALKQGKIVVQESNAGNGWIMTRVKESIPCWEVVGASGETYAGWMYIRLSPVQGLGRQLVPENVINRSWIIYNPDHQYFRVLRGFEDDPVTFVTWYGAYSFAEFYGLSLPTEAQWEYAALGGQDLEFPTDDGTMDCSKANFGCKSYNHGLPYPPGKDFGDPQEPDFAAYPTPAVTDSNRYPANPYGLFNMAGNLREWCLDWYDPGFYQKLAEKGGIAHNPVNLVGEDPPVKVQYDATQMFGRFTHDSRVTRGGTWNYPIVTTYSKRRMTSYPLRSNDHFGFRVVNNEPQEPR